MKPLARWVLGTIGAAVISAVALMPKGQDPYVGEFYGTSRYDSLYRTWALERAKLSVVSNVVQRGQAVADARALPPAAIGAPLVRVDPALGPGVAALLEKRVDDELRGARALPTRHPIAVRAILDTELREMVYYAAVVLPEKPGDACTVVLRVPSPAVRKFGLVSTQRLLGTCAFYAAYGTPSEATSRWMRETRGVSARYLVRPSALQDDTARLKLGVSYSDWSPLVESLLRCRMGVASACLQFVGPESDRNRYFDMMYVGPVDRSALVTEFPGVLVGYSGTWFGDAGGLRAGMLASLAAEMGPERFGAIWRDPRGLQEAYQSSAGESFAGFVQRQVERRTLPYVAGPGIPGLSTALAFAIIAVLGLWAIARSPRQIL